MFDIARYAKESKTKLIGPENTAVSNVSTDSRAVKHGDLYIAIKGPNYDGHSFIAEASQNGAVACMVSRIPDSLGKSVRNLAFLVVPDTRVGYIELARWWRNQFSPLVFGITGSNGKTTVKDMLAKVLRASSEDGAVLATEGNLNNDIGVPRMLLRLRASHRFVVLELGMNHAGEMEVLSKLVRPDIALITNIGTAHIGELGSQDAVAKAKAEIFTGVRQDGIVILNSDDAYFDFLKDQVKDKSIITFGFNDLADIRGEALDSNRLKIISDFCNVSIRPKVNGQHNQINMLATIAATSKLGLSQSSTQKALEEFSGVKGRLEVNKLHSGATLIDDTYNANPDSVSAAIRYTASMSGTKVFVFGDMGELGTFGNAMHAAVGIEAKRRGFTHLFGIGELSRLAVESFGSGGEHFLSGKKLCERILTSQSPGSIFLIKGSRSMRMERFCLALKSGTCE
jgi:UDP-N-acetylmuramoyl-tripeptide--D-alanyl-D-alanine ligase